MKRVVAIVAALLVCGISYAQAQPIPAFGEGFGGMGNEGAPPSPGGYIGPGDVISGANVWYGLRAYNQARATATGNIAIFRRSSDSTTCTGIANASTGDLDLITAYCGGSNLPTFCGVSAGNCFATRLYDQSGANACTGSVSCDVVQATTADQPQLIFNCNFALPCLRFANNGLMGLVSAANLTSLSQPFSVSFVANQTGSTSANNVIGAYGIAVQWGMSSTTNDATFYAGNVVVVAGAAQSSIHSIQFVVSGATSIANIDGTQTTGLNAGTNVGTSNPPAIGENSSGANEFFGDFYENGSWPIGFSNTQQATMRTNQKTYWRLSN